MLPRSFTRTVPCVATIVTDLPFSGLAVAAGMLTARVDCADGPPFRSIREPVHRRAVEVPSASVTVSVTAYVPAAA